MVTVFASLFEVTELKTTGKNDEVISFKTDGATIVMDNTDVTLNIDSTKKKVKMFSLVKAFIEAVNGGEFWMDEIDGIVSEIEADRAELREALKARRNPEEYYGAL